MTDNNHIVFVNNNRLNKSILFYAFSYIVNLHIIVFLCVFLIRNKVFYCYILYIHTFTPLCTKEPTPHAVSTQLLTFALYQLLVTNFGRKERIRTITDRVKVCCASITPLPYNVAPCKSKFHPARHFSSVPSRQLIKRKEVK